MDEHHEVWHAINRLAALVDKVHVTKVGNPETFWDFVAEHTADDDKKVANKFKENIAPPAVPADAEISVNELQDYEHRLQATINQVQLVIHNIRNDFSNAASLAKEGQRLHRELEAAKQKLESSKTKLTEEQNELSKLNKINPQDAKAKAKNEASKTRSQHNIDILSKTIESTNELIKNLTIKINDNTTASAVTKEALNK